MGGFGESIRRRDLLVMKSARFLPRRSCQLSASRGKNVAREKAGKYSSGTRFVAEVSASFGSVDQSIRVGDRHDCCDRRADLPVGTPVRSDGDAGRAAAETAGDG